jgi:ABC-type phosphate transport system auxiliary subunit
MSCICKKCQDNPLAPDALDPPKSRAMWYWLVAGVAAGVLVVGVTIVLLIAPHILGTKTPAPAANSRSMIPQTAVKLSNDIDQLQVLLGQLQSADPDDPNATADLNSQLQAAIQQLMGGNGADMQAVPGAFGGQDGMAPEDLARIQELMQELLQGVDIDIDVQVQDSIETQPNP